MIQSGCTGTEKLILTALTLLSMGVSIFISVFYRTRIAFQSDTDRNSFLSNIYKGLV